GCMHYAPLAQGLLTDRYLKGIPEGSRAAKPHGFLQTNDVTEARLAQVKKLNEIAKGRGQSLAQMAISWLLKDKRVTTVLIGASSVAQLDNNIDALGNTAYTADELAAIEAVLRS
ncbi:MAG: aldo/keto reductase, partial [Bacteroidetes bacterium]|nr:aldo/keto reductase [Bacteroidota bacterium]